MALRGRKSTFALGNPAQTLILRRHPPCLQLTVIFRPDGPTHLTGQTNLVTKHLETRLPSDPHTLGTHDMEIAFHLGHHMMDLKMNIRCPVCRPSEVSVVGHP